ncbi:MAG: response regulator [Chitinivibrionales bacterium]|nr:response regulator [Chitinivibrionales bacterium]
MENIMSDKKMIVIIDDDAEFSAGMQEILEHEDFATAHAPNGKEGLALVEKMHPALIILDVMMDYNTEGFDVSKALASRKELATIPVLLITGISREMNLPFSFEAHEKYLPVTDVIEKPIQPQKLIEKVHNLLTEQSQTNP